MDDRFYVPGWMRREAERRAAVKQEDCFKEELLHLVRAHDEAEQARDALLWKQEEEKRSLEEQRTAMALHRKEEKRLFANLGVNTREEYYRKKLANRSNDVLRELLHRKIARKKAKRWKLTTKTIESNAKLRELLRRSTHSGSLLPIAIPPNEYHRERRIFAPPINRLSRDAQHRSWNGYEWEIV